MKVNTGLHGPRYSFTLVYSMAKMLKTTLMLLIPPELRPVAFLDTDRGAQIRLRLLAQTLEERKRNGVQEPIPEYAGPWVAEGIDIYTPELGSYYADMWEFATKVLHSGKYKSAVVDTISRMSADVLKEVKGTDYGGGGRVGIKVGTAQTVQPSPGDYGLAQTRIMEFLQALDEAPVHVFMTSHERTGEVREGDVVKRVVGGPSSVGTALLETIPAICDQAIRLETKPMKVQQADGRFKLGNHIVMRTMNHSIFAAGDRGGLFSDGQVLDPKVFWDQILATINMVAAQAATEGEAR